MPSPYHVRLAVSQYGEQFRAELFTEDLGDTEGDVLTELPASVGEWVPYLAQGAELPPDAARQLGKDLFAALLGQPENAKKWSEVLAQAARNKQPIRLLIDATTEPVRDLPFGLLCEPHDDWFLFRGQRHPVEFVRILRRCSPRPLKLRDRLRVLIVVAEPTSADVPPFDAPLRLQQLVEGLKPHVDLILCGPNGAEPLSPSIRDFAPYTRTTRDAIRKALLGEYDVLHLLAHGHGAGVLLCAADGKPAETTASELGEWCSAGRTPLAFLQVCKAGQTANRGGFGGVAQQLLNPRGGNLAAVVASTFPLDAEHSTQAAVQFYSQVAAGRPPEEALSAEGPEADWCWAFLELWARPGALGGTQSRAAFQFVSPYRGLSSFSEQDADLFFGRRSEVAELMQILRTDPVVAVVGDSGSGKTSLLQAGLVHAIRRDGLAGSDRWRIVSLRPGYRPAQALLMALKPGTTDEPTPEALKAALRTESQPLIVVFDQFEEVFTLARDKAELHMLTSLLAETVVNHGNRFRLVLGMRSEFLGQAASVPGLSRLIRRPWVLRPPSAKDLREIVAGPAEHCGYTFAPGLLDRILADPLLGRDQAGSVASLPLLQFALERLWLKAVETGTTEFTNAEFDEIGGMGKAIAQHAEAVYQATPTATELGPTARTVAEQIITSLVNARGTRQPRSREALQAETGQPEAAREVVDYLVGERLLTVRSDPEDMTKSLVDLSHEALIQNWDRLRGWLAEDPQGRAMREEFRKAAERWESGVAGIKPRSRFGLPGSDVARNYLAWIDTSQPKLSPAHQEFGTEMRGMLGRQRRARRAVAGLLVGLTVTAMITAVYARSQASAAKTSAEQANKSAQDARDNEETAKKQTRQAQVNAATLALEGGYAVCENGRPRLGILGIANALKLCPDDAPELRNVILGNLAAWGPHLLCLDAVQTLPAPIVATDPTGKFALLKRPGDRPEDKLYGGGGITIVPVFQLYNIDTLQPAGPPFRVQWLKPDGSFDSRHLVTWGQLLPTGRALLSGGGTSSVWDCGTGRSFGKPMFHGGAAVAFRPDSFQIAASDGQSRVTLFDPLSGQPNGEWFDAGGPVFDLSYSPDGKLIVAGCGRKADAASDAKSPVDNIGDSMPEGQVLLFEVGKKEPRWRRQTLTAVTCARISPDATRVTAGGMYLQTWDLSGKALDSVKPTREAVAHLAFDPNLSSSYIAGLPSGAIQIMHADDDVRLGGERLSPQGAVAGVGFRADGRVFTANGDGNVRMWNRPHHLTAPRSPLLEFRPSKADPVLSVAFRPDGKAVALGTRGGLVHMYDLANPQTPRRFTCTYLTNGARRAVTEVRFSTDGSRIIAHDDVLDAFVFDANGGPGPLTDGNGRWPQGVADDGRTAVFMSRVATPYYVMPLDAGKRADPPRETGLNPNGTLARMLGEIDTRFLVRSSRVAFSPDRSLVALLNTEGKIFLFKSATGERIAEIEHLVDGERDGIRSVAFCPKGERLLTCSPKARGIWSANAGTKIDYLTNRIGIQVTRFSPQGSLVLGATNFSMAQVWDSGGRMAVPLPLVHGAQVWGVSADPSESLIATASYDRAAYIWDRKTGRPLSTPLPHRMGVSDAIFSPDGKTLLTGCWDGAARLWTVPVPLKDEPERIRLWVETLTGLSAEAGESSELLLADAWRQRKAKLDALGGPPIR